ncbi:hypothetical protein [Mycobacterium alsense]|uniref:hypothetical protein n=1 Tax=Mycobacterium alsense TaxID=324058 RepID=UPI000A5D0E02|nr:hypothetical protein [Mycobacterium alsense]
MAVRVSELFDLGTSQGGLDFVDVDVTGDTPVYIEPRAIRTQQGDWSESCVGLLQSYFECLLDAIKAGEATRIATLLTPTFEPNETHLGQSEGEARGRGLGSGRKAEKLIESLISSKAVQSGLLTDLEETALLVPGVGRDTISDITTSVIRGPLIRYTQEMCELYGIPMETQYSGMAWSNSVNEWEYAQLLLPRANNDKLLLVPRSIVRFDPMLDTDKYYRGYLRPYFEEQELDDPASQLVRLLKGGRRKVQLGALDSLLGTTKPAIAENTEAYPQALDEYVNSVDYRTSPAPTSNDYEAAQLSERVDYLGLYESVKAIAPGRPGATSYHRAVASLLSAVFDGVLGNQQVEFPVHNGRKRLDIKYDNVANAGFFRWLSLHRNSAIVPVECKNYSTDPGNPEVDQLAMRLSPDRGQIGMMVCREVEDRELLMQRQRDVVRDAHGYILVLDDSDLLTLAQFAEDNRYKEINFRYSFPMLRAQFDELL